MKKTYLLFSLVFIVGLLNAQGIMPSKWTKPANTYKWFKSTGERVRGMAFNTTNNHLYVATRDTLGTSLTGGIIILDASTGDSIGSLNMTGISGGVYPFNRVVVTSDGRIYTTNLQTAVTKAAPLKIYTWADESAAPVLVFSDSIQGPRLGDALAVAGSGQGTYLYVSGNANPGPVTIFKRSADTLVQYKTIVPAAWATGVISIGTTANGLGDFWVNVNGKVAQKFDTNGVVLDTIPSTITSSAGSGASYFEFAGKKYFAMYSGSATVSTPSIVRFLDITVSGSKGVVVALTPSMGTTANANAPLGEVIFSPSDTSIYILSVNNNLGKYSVTQTNPSVSITQRVPFVPMSGENDTVFFNIASMKPVSNSKLTYFGYKTSVSDQSNTDSADVSLTLVSGSQYKAIVPASVNRDGRRIQFRAEVTDAVGVSAVVAVPGYFAGITKLAYQGGPREVDTLGSILHKGYGIRTQAVVIVEDSIFQVANSEIVLQDSLGGVTVFKSGTPFDVKRGNAYIVTGTTDNPTGGGSKFQFVDPGLTFTDLGPAPPIMPRVITIKQLLANGELYENQLVAIRNATKAVSSAAWPALAASVNMTFTDGSGDSTTMRIDGDTDIDGSTEPMYPITIVGPAGQFDNSSPFNSGYQWLPRDMNDIKFMPTLQSLNFEAPNIDYTFTDFSGAKAMVVPNPQKTGLDTSNFVVKMVKGAGDPWAGSFLNLDKPIDFKGTKLFKVKVFMPKVGAKLLLKVENLSNGAFNMEKDAIGTVANAWQELYYDFSGIDTSKQYQRVVLICDLGTSGDGSANFTYLIDDIQQYVAPLTKQIVGVKNSKMTVGISNVGHIGALNGYQDTLGFMFNGINTLYEGSLIMGNAKNRVPNSARFEAAPSWNPGFRHRSPIFVTKEGSTTETMTSFDDSLYGNPLGIRIDQHTAIDTAAGKDGYLLLGYDVINTSGATINNFLIGSFFDFDLTAAGDVDRGGILKDSTNTIPGVNGGVPFKINLAYMYNGTTFVGLVPLTQTVFAGGRIAVGPDEVYGGKMVDSNKYQYISTFRTTNPFTDGGVANDMSIFGSVGPYTIAANDTTSGAFGLVVGSSLIELLNNARAAQKAAVQEYGITLQILTGVDGEKSNLPTSYALDQNYPNPFNPTTTIRFALPNSSMTKLVVYDVLGREVRTLINNNTDAGYHEIVWNGRNNLGSQVASGMYIYRIESGSFISTKKMMMLK